MLNIAGGIILAVLFFVFLEQILTLGVYLLAAAVGLFFVFVLIMAISSGLGALFTSVPPASESHISVTPLIISVAILVWVFVTQIKSSNVSLRRRLKRWKLKLFDHKPGFANRLEEFDDETKKQEIINRDQKEENKRLKEQKQLQEKLKEQERLQERRKEQQRIKLEHHQELLSFLKNTSSFSDFQITSENFRLIISHPLLPKCYIQVETAIYDNNISFIITRFEKGQIYGSPDTVYSQKSAEKKIARWVKSVDLITQRA